MDELESKMLEKYKERIKRQNQKVKENYDKVSVTLPKGTVERIKALGMTINSAINSSLIAYLECLEESANEDAQTAQISQETEQTENITIEHQKAEIKPNKVPVDILALQAELESRRAEDQARKEAKKKAKEQAEKEREEEYMQMIRNLRNGVQGEEDTEKESQRQESIARARMEY